MAMMTARLRICLFLAIAAGVVSLVSAQEGCSSDPASFHPCALARAARFEPPRTHDGRPDLHGFWRGATYATENIEAHPKTADDNGGPSLIVDPPDGRVPYQRWAISQREVNATKFIDPNIPCFPSGVPRSLYTPTNIEIVQTPGYVVFAFERAHTYWIIPTDARPHIGRGVGLWQGDQRGRWDGNTLVVDVTNIHARSWFDQAGNFYSDGAHIVSRFTLVDRDTIHYEATIDDPHVYTRPWTMAFPLKRNGEPGFELLEEACFEGERNTDPLIELGYRIYPGLDGARPR
ncbi:MAG: hypothetical protein HYU37_20200 [Acidobacteria bacterium]|nr:hypothetical protein [Acidobacteriota bacterium]